MAISNNGSECFMSDINSQAEYSCQWQFATVASLLVQSRVHLMINQTAKLLDWHRALRVRGRRLRAGYCPGETCDLSVDSNWLLR